MSQIIRSATILPMFIDIDPNNITVILDIDDVCWPFVHRASYLAGVDSNKMHTFAIKDNQLYTAEEKARLFQAFRDPKTFENIRFYPAVKKIYTMHEIGIKVKPNSKSFFDEISNLKRAQLQNVVSVLRDEDFIMTVDQGDHATTGKDVGEEVTFFIDDNPHNIVTSEAKYNLLPCQTWNTSPEEQYRMRSKNTYFFDNLDNIFDTIISSVLFWRRTYYSNS